MSVVKARGVPEARSVENVQRITAEGFLEDRLVVGDVFLVCPKVVLRTCTRLIGRYRSTRPGLSNVWESAPDNACMHLQLHYGQPCSAKLHAWEGVTSAEMHDVSMSLPF